MLLCVGTTVEGYRQILGFIEAPPQDAVAMERYFHHLLCAAWFPKSVIPLMPEPIVKNDGATKNDSERNACKRFLDDFRREHPQLKTVVLQDGLFSNAPYLRLLAEHDLRYIIGAKPGDHTFLFNFMDRSDETQEVVMEVHDIHDRFRFHNNANASNAEVRVHVLEVYETKPHTKKHPEPKTMRFSWVTDLLLDETNLMAIMRAGRSRWNIEHQTINTLKNQGYHFEPNDGHGYKHLSAVFACLIMLALLVDQVEQLSDVWFQDALAKMKRLKYLREDMRLMFRRFHIESWQAWYRSFVEEECMGRLRMDSS